MTQRRSSRQSRFGSRPKHKPRPFARPPKRSASETRTAAGSVFRGAAAAKVKKPAGKGSAVQNTPAAEEQFTEHRLQRILAAAGYGSRRACEQLIIDGRVEVDGVVAQLGDRADPRSQKIRVDGESLPKMKPVYLAVNKPKGFLCTSRDQQGRRRVIDLVPQKLGRVFPIGRLDQESEGLIILTNDGALCERLAHPRFEVAKKYHVQVAGLVEQELVDQLKKGIHVAEGVVQADEVKILSSYKKSSILEITLREGKNREIRRMLARVEHKVLHLKRVAVGPVKLAKLPPGEYRPLTSEEIARLYGAAGRPAVTRSAVRRLKESRPKEPREPREPRSKESPSKESRSKKAKPASTKLPAGSSSGHSSRHSTRPSTRSSSRPSTRSFTKPASKRTHRRGG